MPSHPGKRLHWMSPLTYPVRILLVQNVVALLKNFFRKALVRGKKPKRHIDAAQPHQHLIVRAINARLALCGAQYVIHDAQIFLEQRKELVELARPSVFEELLRSGGNHGGERTQKRAFSIQATDGE